MPPSLVIWRGISIADYNWAALGKALRRLRIQKRMTQDDLARASGVHRSLISKAENNRIVLPLGSLSHIAEVLGVTLVDMLDGVDLKHSVPEIIRRKDQPVIPVIEGEASAFGYTYQQIFVRPQFAVVRVRVPAGLIPPQLYTHREHEFGYIMIGQCTLKYGNTHYELDTGDSYWIDGMGPHVLIADTNTDCIVLALFSVTVSNPGEGSRIVMIPKDP